MAYRTMGKDVISDFAFRGLEPGRHQDAVTSISRICTPLPEPGLLLREILDERRAPVIRVFGGSHGLQYWITGAGRFWIAPSGRTVRYHFEDGTPLADVENALIGPVLGLAFQLQGQVQLHASAVAVDSAVIAFSGTHGVGKSTLAASFVREGFALVADDVLPLRESADRFLAFPSLARMKLWGDSLEALGEDPNRYEHVLSWAEKRRVTVGKYWGRMAPEELSLSVVYLLQPHTNRGREVEFSELEPVDAALRLVGNMYLAELLRGEQAKRALAIAGRMASHVRIRHVSYHRSFVELPELRAAILTDLQRCGSVA